MEAIFWSFKTIDAFAFAWPLFLNLTLAFVISQTDLPLLLAATSWRWMRRRPESFRPLSASERPSGLVVIPSLLRNRDDLVAITTSLESAAENGYPAKLLLVASVDGVTEEPALYAELEAWITAHRAAYPSNIHLYLTGTKTRLGKMMAVEAAVDFVNAMVAGGVHAEFPRVYFSLDGDGTLSPRALERLVHRLTTPHPITGNPRRVVSGKIYIRADLVWGGWRSFASVAGMIHNLVAREFIVSNLARANWKLMPQIGLPGALYCTWGEVLHTAPRFMTFMQGLRFVDWLKWLVGGAPPKFSESGAAPLAEALTGASDDTCIAFVGSIATWVNGKLSFDAPRTPLHALERLVRGYIYERSHDYAPDAVVYTYTPTTVKGLWMQRVRWNSSRVECAGRFWKSFWYHWDIGIPTWTHLATVLHNVFEMGIYYVLMPYLCFGRSHILLGYLMGYVGQTLAHSIYTLIALALEPDRRRYWPTVLSLPLAPLFLIAINFFGCINGVLRDIFFFGNWTNFAPEWTLIKGRTERIALLFRARRFVLLAIRALVHGDVPLGWFWFGWKENAWCPSGFEGWTTKKAPRAILTLKRLPAPVAEVAAPPSPLTFAPAAAAPAAAPGPVPAPALSVAPRPMLSLVPRPASMPAPQRVPTIAPRRQSTTQRAA